MLEYQSALFGLPLRKSEPDICYSLADLYEGNFDWKLFYRIARNADLNYQIIKYIDVQGYYLIDTLHSPVIEASKCNLNQNEKIISRGRLFYYTGFFDENGVWMEKDVDFIVWASDLFKKFSNFINFKKNNTGDLVSPEVDELIKKGWTLR